MPEPTSAGGGYSCQVCGATYGTQQLLIEHGREQHPGKAVTWGDPEGSTTTTATTSSERTTGELEKRGTEVKSGMESMGEKMKAGAEAIGSKMKDPDKDLKTEYQKKKEE